MHLHYIDGSPFARMIRVLAREHGVALDEIEVTRFPPPESFLAINPMGQVPALVVGGKTYFPTRIALEALLERIDAPASGIAAAISRPDSRLDDDQLLAVIHAMGDALAAHHYAKWAGTGPVDRNQLGFDPARRNMVRVLATLDWLEQRLTPDGFQPGHISVQDVALACLILWSESRGPIAWRGRPRIGALIARLQDRPSFQSTIPRPHWVT